MRSKTGTIMFDEHDISFMMWRAYPVGRRIPYWCWCLFKTTRSTI